MHYNYKVKAFNELLALRHMGIQCKIQNDLFTQADIIPPRTPLFQYHRCQNVFRVTL